MVWARKTPDCWSKAEDSKLLLTSPIYIVHVQSIRHEILLLFASALALLTIYLEIRDVSYDVKGMAAS